MARPALARDLEEHDLTSADQWFAALDQRRIGAGGDSWTAVVSGVHPDGAALWIQLAPSDNPYRSIVLHVLATANVESVVSRLTCAADDEGRPRVIDLTAEVS
jgi:hypothetical protein